MLEVAAAVGGPLPGTAQKVASLVQLRKLFQVKLLQAFFLLKCEQENPFSLDPCDSERVQGWTALDRLKLIAPAHIPLTENTLEGDQESSAGHRASLSNKDSSTTFQSAKLFGSCRIARSFESKNRG